MDQCFEHPIETSHHECSSKWKLAPISAPRNADDSKDDRGFDCSICLGSVNDPVVTFCGHLFCWPCIYEWIKVQTLSSEKSKNHPQCPVCKSNVSEKTLIPLYGGGLTKNVPKCMNHRLSIPERPASPTCSIMAGSTLSPRQLHHRRHRHQTQTDFDQYDATVSANTMGLLHSSSAPMFGELMYARIFGNQTTLYGYGDSYNMSGLGSPRVRRRVVQMDRSLSRFSFFLLCFVLFCLAVF
ncbi:hypothetical protein Droror1_Dr00019309 [Drosera rotundifolia]